MRSSSTIAPPNSRTQPLIVWSIRLLALIGLGICGYLFYQTIVESELPAGCGRGSECEAVLGSQWARWLGIPVSLPAAGIYFLLFAASILVDPVFEAATRRMAWQAMTFLAVLAAGAAVWFIAIQKIAVGSFCPWCLSVHACGLLVAALIAFERFNPSRMEEPSSPGSRPRRVWPVALIALLLLSALPVGQIHARPKSSVLALSMGRLQFDPHLLPILGDARAPHVILIMADYTCPHCRRTHPAIEAIRKRYGGQLAVAVALVPINSKCNRYVHQTPRNAADACDLAKEALAVWRAKPEAFDEMDRWLFSETLPPSPSEAREHAVALVGEASLKAAEADPWVGQAMNHGVELYARSITLSSDSTAPSSIPKLVTANEVLTGEIDEPNFLFQLLEREMDVKPVQ